MLVAESEIASGDRGTLETLHIMRDSALAWGRSWWAPAVVGRILRAYGIDGSHRDAVVLALADAVRRLPYLPEGYDSELLREPPVTLNGDGPFPPGGDCDCKALLLASLLWGASIPEQALAAVEWPNSPGYAHVVNLVQVEGGRILPLDVAYPGTPLGSMIGEPARMVVVNLADGETRQMALGQWEAAIAAIPAFVGMVTQPIVALKQVEAQKKIAKIAANVQIMALQLQEQQWADQVAAARHSVAQKAETTRTLTPIFILAGGILLALYFGSRA